MQGGSQKVRLEGEGHMLPKQAVFLHPCAFAHAIPFSYSALPTIFN